MPKGSADKVVEGGCLSRRGYLFAAVRHRCKVTRLPGDGQGGACPVGSVRPMARQDRRSSRPLLSRLASFSLPLGRAESCSPPRRGTAERPEPLPPVSWPETRKPWRGPFLRRGWTTRAGEAWLPASLIFLGLLLLGEQKSLAVQRRACEQRLGENGREQQPRSVLPRQPADKDPARVQGYAYRVSLPVLARYSRSVPLHPTTRVLGRYAVSFSPRDGIMAVIIIRFRPPALRHNVVWLVPSTRKRAEPRAAVE